MRIKFTDGIDVDTSGELRPLHLWDGWYVVGQGILTPVNSLQDAKEFIEKLKKKEK